MPSMESDLRGAISGAIANSLDSQIISGSGASPNLSGLIHQATDVAAESNEATFANTVALLAGEVDGKHANSWADLRVLIGTATFAKLASLFVISPTAM